MVKIKKKRNLKYSPHLITYIDILGFRELVKEKTPNFISHAIQKVIQATAPDDKISKANEENYVKFSDLIVHTVPILSPANKKYRDGIVFQEIQGLATAQASLVGDGLLLRGAVTMGMLERTYGVLFGPGIIAAHDLEREQARFPRIVVESDLIEALKVTPLLTAHPYEEEIKYISQYIKRDDDGVVFIDYVGGMQGEAADPADWLEFLHAHKAFVEKNIAKFIEEKHVLAKYLWLRKYHNAVVQTRLKLGFYEEFLVKGPDSASDVPLLSPMVRPDREESSDDEP
jgi:hypothetical protein